MKITRLSRVSRAAGATLSLALILTAWPLFGAPDGSADPLLEPPVVNTRPGPEYQDNVRAGAMIIGMDRTPKGRLWGCWTGTGDNSESYFILATSDDGGTTWSKPRVVIDPQELPGKPPRYSLIGNLWTDPSGRLWLFFDQHMKGFTQTDWYITCDNPDAAEPVWSRPVCFADGSTLNKPTILKNGDWLLPVSLLAPGRIRPDQPDELSRQPMAHVYVSTDKGKMWQRRGGVAIPEAEVNHNEHMIVELRDGRLWMLLRTRYGMAESYSPDAGRTWSQARPSTIQNPSTRFFVRRLASGRLLLVKNGPIEVRLAKRSHLTAFLSEDDGKTWSRGLLLDDRNALSYPDGFQSPDGLIHILYDWNRHTDAEVLCTTFREEDVLAGKFVSRDARPLIVADKARAPHLSQSTDPNPQWTKQAAAEAKLDFTSVAYDGSASHLLVSDTTLGRLPDGSWILLLHTGRDGQSKPLSATVATRSTDNGKTWTPPEPFDAGFPRAGDTLGRGPAELIGDGNDVALFHSTHGTNWGDSWHSWISRGDAALTAWSKPAALPGRLANRTFVRGSIVTRDRQILVPFQHYEPTDRDCAAPRCGVLISKDGGKTWTEHGDIRLAPVNRSFGWAESNLVEIGEGRIVMLVRQTGLMGLLYKAESIDGGTTWPKFATLDRAPHPGTATFFSLGGNRVAMLHNPNNKLALWISFDGMKTWPYQRPLPQTSCVGPKEYMNHAHGFVSPEGKWLHFVYEDSRHRAVHYSAKLPVGEIPGPP